MLRCSEKGLEHGKCNRVMRHFYYCLSASQCFKLLKGKNYSFYLCICAQHQEGFEKVC